MALLQFLGISLAVNLILFLVAYKMQTDKLTDFSYSVSFMLVSLYALAVSQKNPATLIGLALIWVWALRLGSYLVMRITKIGRDKRFDGMRENFWQFGRFWLYQAISVVIIALPYLLLARYQVEFLWISLFGILLWATGLVIEMLADYQKFQFITSGGKDWIDGGLWALSRHPNYLGEIMIWTGLYLYCLPYLPMTAALIGLVSPIFIFILLRFVSGVPMLEKSAEQRWGERPEYIAYKMRTGLIWLKFRNKVT